MKDLISWGLKLGLLNATLGLISSELLKAQVSLWFAVLALSLNILWATGIYLINLVNKDLSFTSFRNLKTTSFSLLMTYCQLL